MYLLYIVTSAEHETEALNDETLSEVILINIKCFRPERERSTCLKNRSFFLYSDVFEFGEIDFRTTVNTTGQKNLLTGTRKIICFLILECKILPAISFSKNLENSFV